MRTATTFHTQVASVVKNTTKKVASLQTEATSDKAN